MVTSIVVAICFASILFAVGVFLLVMVKVSPHDDARQASFGVVMGVALITLGAIMLFLSWLRLIRSITSSSKSPVW